VTVVCPPITVVRQPLPPPPRLVPPVACPAPTVHRLEETAPRFDEAKPCPPVQVVPFVPPTVRVAEFRPPAVGLMVREVRPPVFAEAKPPPPLTIVERTVNVPRAGPPCVLPPVTVCFRPEPPPAVFKDAHPAAPCPCAPPR
jgi:hypothetical protein